MRRMVALLMVMFMALMVFAGCGKSSDTGQTNETSPKETSDKTTGGEDAAKEPITFTMYSADANPNADQFKSPVAEKIKEITGVTLNINHEAGSDPKQTLSIMAASGDYPDLVFAKGDLYLLKDAGGILQLDDLIEQHGPNIKALFGDYLPRLRWSLDDPHIYYIGSYPVYQESLTPGGAFWLQHAVVKDLGYPQINTLADYENAIKEYYHKYPEIDGQPTIPFTLLADGWRFLISVTNPAWAATGGSDDGEWYVNPDTYQAVRHVTREEEKEYFKWLNHMYNEGLLDPESFTQKYDQYKAKIASGRVLAMADAQWEINDAEVALRQAGMEDRMHGVYPVMLSSDMKCRVNQSPGYTGGWGISITTKCKDPERAMEFLDWMSTEEAQILTHWGIENVHWKYDSNGKRVFLPEIEEQRRTDPSFSKKTGIGNYTYPFPEWGNGKKDSTGNYVQPDSEVEDIIKNYTDTEKEVLAGYGATTWMDLFPKPNEFPVKPWGAVWMYHISDSDITAIDSKLTNDIGPRLVPKAILAPKDQFDKEWDNYLNEMNKAGLPKVTDEINRLLQEKLELWGVE